ncbi:MAG: hypothetical protein Q9M40_10875 [Sulfurimonas sp.]|nr:hypothetical protein [Sulfurimonas sp.]
MQVLNHEGFEKGEYSATLAPKATPNNSKKGKKYHLLNPVIALTIVNFTMFWSLRNINQTSNS